MGLALHCTLKLMAGVNISYNLWLMENRGRERGLAHNPIHFLSTVVSKPEEKINIRG